MTELIHEKMLAVMRTVNGVAKRDRNTYQNFNFRGIDAVVNALGPALREHGIFVLPEALDSEYGEVHTKSGKATEARIRMAYHFIAEDGSRVTASVYGGAFDSGDKHLPKASSVAFRTALLQVFALPTDERDPDADTYQAVAPPPITKEQGERIGQLFTAKGIGSPDNLPERTAAIKNILGRPATATDMTAEEAEKLIQSLSAQENQEQAEKNIAESLGATKEAE